MPSLQGPHLTATLADARLAGDLCDVLAEEYNIAASTQDHTLVVVFPGITARCEGGLIWWTYAPGPAVRSAVHCPPAAMSPEPVRHVMTEG
ncbi:hypothetical protein ACIBIZ_08650 [Nonomuraea spiralis]|uniref:hypothetical protein n=1 Tax=Nonomuraea TaxID=83681 RepID=UPI000F78F496|nr:hypothetical protein [Nonomuraea sp. WAC 01424]